MIPRYSHPEIYAIWQDENKYRIWFEIEAYACEAMGELGIIPKSVAKNIRSKGSFNVKRIDEIEKTTKHDVIAFLTNLAEYIGEDSRFVHQGMTSSDVIDTCLAVQLKQAGEILLSDIEKLLETLRQKAIEHQHTMCIGRSHGIHAEPISFGLKMLTFYEEFKRNKTRLERAIEEIATCAISGAVGTFANIAPYVEEFVAKKLGLKPEPVSTQVIPRDRHAYFFSTLAVVAGAVERLATEIRHLQRTEVLEAEEFFAAGQKGSSAMPHKKNPILSENLTGLARIVRGCAMPALENIALWHERDISHSSVERIIAPDATVHLDFALRRLNGVVKNLVVHKENMQKNLDGLGGLIFSQNVLLALTQKGLSREASYEIVQKNALKVWENGTLFIEELKKDAIVSSKLTATELQDIFDIKRHTKNIDVIFKRVLAN